MISIIAAVGKNYELGKDNDLIWHLKDDLRNFKNITMGKKIIMGANTYKSLPSKLEGRTYIVLSKTLKNLKDAQVFNNFNVLLQYLNNLQEEIIVIGGASIYKLFLPYVDKIYLTEIDDTKLADVYFPIFDKNKYHKKIIKKIEENGINYRFVEYERNYEKRQVNSY